MYVCMYVHVHYMPRFLHAHTHIITYTSISFDFKNRISLSLCVFSACRSPPIGGDVMVCCGAATWSGTAPWFPAISAPWRKFCHMFGSVWLCKVEEELQNTLVISWLLAGAWFGNMMPSWPRQEVRIQLHGHLSCNGLAEFHGEICQEVWEQAICHANACVVESSEILPDGCIFFGILTFNMEPGLIKQTYKCPCD